jgi:hypothetical protein
MPAHVLEISIFKPTPNDSKYFVIWRHLGWHLSTLSIEKSCDLLSGQPRQNCEVRKSYFSTWNVRQSLNASVRHFMPENSRDLFNRQPQTYRELAAVPNQFVKFRLLGNIALFTHLKFIRKYQYAAFQTSRQCSNTNSNQLLKDHPSTKMYK